MDPAELMNILNTSLIVLFAIVIGGLVLGFFRGLFRGWRYGTFRLAALVILIAIALLTLAPIASAIGNADLAGLGLPAISFQLTNGTDTVTVGASFGSLFSVFTSLVTQIMEFYQADMSPTEITNYAIALSLSLVEIIIMLVDAVLIATFGQILILLLWHIGFKRFIPKEKRKASYKKGRLWSAFEEMVGVALIMALFLSPLTSMVNSFASNWMSGVSAEDQNSLKANDETYATISDVVDAYNNSIFAKAFFSWAKTADGETYDAALMSFLTQGNYENASVSFVNELQVAVKAYSYAVAGGLMSKDGITQQTLALFATSSYAPKLLRVLGASSLVDGLLPSALALATNIDPISQYLKTDAGFDFSSYDYGATISGLADIYDAVVNSGILSKVIDQDGNLIKDPNVISQALGTEYQTSMDEIIADLGSEQLKLLHDLIEAAVVNEVLKEDENPPAEGTITLGLKDFVPALGELDADHNGVPDSIPSAISSIDWAGELAIVYDSLERIVAAAPEALPLIVAPLANGSGGYDEATLKSLTSIIIDHLADVEGAIAGTEGSDEKCLLDSSFLENAMPKFLTIMETALNDSFSLSGEGAIDLSSVASYLNKQTGESDLSGQAERYKTEFRSLFGVLETFASSPDGKALIENTDTLPGLYFTPDADHMFLGAKAGLIDALSEALRRMDDSRLASVILPAVIKNFMTGPSSPLASFGADISLDFDVNGLGSKLADIMTTYGSCQDLISYLSSMGSVTGAHDADVALKALASFETPDGESQLYALLDLFYSSPILNPQTGTPNANVYALINTLVKSVFGDYSAELASVIETSSFDGATEMAALVSFIQKASSYGILESFDAVSSGNLSPLRAIDFGDLFSPLDGSCILKSFFGKALDDKLSGTGLLTEGVSFANVTDWAEEGSSLNALVKAAAEIGDLANIDFFGSDADAITKIIKVLAASQIFRDGSDYLFPKFFAEKITSSLANSPDIGSFFTDEGKTTSDPNPFSALTSDILSVNTVEGWIGSGNPGDDGEAGILGTLIRDNSLLGGINGFSADADLSKYNPLIIEDMLTSASSSQAFGRVMAAHLFQKINEAIVDSGQSAFELANVGYMWGESLTKADREREVGHLCDMVATILDPVYGFLAPDGSLDFDLDLDTVSPEFLVKPLLSALADSQVFNTAKAGETMTAFGKELSVTLVNANYYASEAIADHVVLSVGVWDQEIDALCEALSAIKATGLQLSGDFDLDPLFATDAEGGRVKVYDLLKAISGSTLLYMGFPAKMQEIIDNASSSSAATGIDLGGANLYYEGTDPTYATLAAAPYGDDECVTLSYVFKDLYAIKDTSLDDIATLKANEATELVASLAKSHIFNTLKAGKTESVFESAMALFFGNDEMKDLYYSAGSPKDAVAGASYADSRSKAVFAAHASFPYLSAEEDGRLRDTSSIYDPLGTDSLTYVVRTIQNNPGVSAALKGGSATSLSESDIALIMKALVGCPWTEDIAPNFVAKTLSDPAIQVSTIDMSRAAPYYFYYYDGTVYGAAADYSRRYSDDEIDNLAAIVVSLKDETALLSDLNGTPISSHAQIESVRELLTNLSVSRIFERAGANGIDDPAGITAASELPVFGQIMYLVYDSSKLASRAYSPIYDPYASYGDKLLAGIKGYAADAWPEEIDHLTTNDDGTHGLLQKAFEEGYLASGADFSSSNIDFSSISPAKTTELLAEVNEVDLVADLVPYESSSLLGKTIGLSVYSSATKSFAGLSSSSFDVTSFALTRPVISLTVTATGSAPTVSYRKNGASYEASTSDAGPSFGYDLSADRPLWPALAITVPDGLITGVTVTYDASDYLIGQAGYRNGGIASLGSLASVLYDESSSSYLDLGNAADLSSFLTSGTASDINTLFAYVADPHGFYRTAFDASSAETAEGLSRYLARDLTMRQVLTFSYADPTYGSLTVDLPKYLPHGSSSDATLLYGDVKAILDAEPADVASAWLAAHILDVSKLDAITQMTGPSAFIYQGHPYMVKRAHTLMEAYAKDDFLYGLIDETQPYLTWQSQLISGVSLAFSREALTYAETPADYFYDVANDVGTTPANALNYALRSTDNLAGADAYEPSASDDAAFLSAMKGILRIGSYLRFQTMADVGLVVGSAKVTPAAKSEITAILSSFQDLDASSGLVPVIFYQGLFYEYFVNRGYFHAGVGGDPDLDYLDRGPFGANGYFALSGAAILTS